MNLTRGMLLPAGRYVYVVRCLVLALLPLVAASSSFGGVVLADFSTVFRHQQRPYFAHGDEDFSTLYERARLTLYDMGIEGLSLQASGWLRYDIQESYYKDDFDADLKTFFADYRTRDRSFHFRAGRQWVSEGVGVAHLDGALGTYVTPAGLGLTLYAGRPVDYGEYDDSSGDFYGGMRAFYRLPFWKAEIGVSGSLGKDDGEDAEERIGLDLTLQPTDWMDVSGYAFYDRIAEDWMDQRIDLTFRPIRDVHLSLGYQHVVPSYYLSKTSIFWVFSDTEQERWSVAASWDATARLTFYADYAHMTYDQSDRVNDPQVPDIFEDFQAPDARGDEAGVKVRYRYGKRYPSVCSAEVRYLNGPNGRLFSPADALRDEDSPIDEFHDGDDYFMVRGYVMQFLRDDLYVTADTSHYIYSEDVSHYYSAGVDYRKGNWQFVANGGYGTTPYAEDDFRLTLKLTRKFRGGF